MVLQKHWYTVKELSDKWQCPISDLIHYAQTGELEVCADWKELTEKFNSFHHDLMFGERAVFIEQQEYYFSEPEFKRPEVISGIKFKESLFPILALKEAKSKDVIIYEPDLNENSPAISRLIALDSELFFHIYDDHLWLPASSSPDLPRRIGFLSDFDFCLFSETLKGMSLSLDSIVVTKAEIDKLESAERDKRNNADPKPENQEKYLKIIMGMIGLLKEQSASYTQNVIVDKLLEKFADTDLFPGETTIKQVFSKANKFKP